MWLIYNKEDFVVNLTTTLRHLSEVTLFPRKKEFLVILHFFPEDNGGGSISFSLTINDEAVDTMIGSPMRFLEDEFDGQFLPENETNTPTVINCIAMMLSGNDHRGISVKLPYFFGLMKKEKKLQYGGMGIQGVNQLNYCYLKKFSAEERQATIEIFQILGRLYDFKVAIDNRCCVKQDCCPDNPFK